MHNSPPPPPPLPPPAFAPHPMHNNPSNMESNSEQPKSTALSFVLNLSHNFTQLCIGGSVFSVLLFGILLAEAPDYLFPPSYAQHIILCTIGYFVMMTQAILAFSPFGWATHLKLERRRLIHTSMQVGGSVLVITGSIRQIITVENNFSTAHGIFGILAMILAFVNCAGDVLSMIINNKFIKILHAVVGCATISFAFVALLIALNGEWYRYSTSDGIANFAITVTVFALVGSLLMACVNNAKRLLNN